MADPDKNALTEIEMEEAQRDRLMELFCLVETFDERESVIAFCETVIDGVPSDE